MKKHILITLKVLLLLAAADTVRLRAENPGNPFGSGAEVPGSEYQEEDDLTDSGKGNGNFPVSPGFPAGEDTPAFAPEQPPTESVEDTTPAARPVSPRGRNARGNAPISGAPRSSGRASAPTSAKTAPSAPTLPEYLELDSSVKALEVKNFDLPDKEIKDVVTLISKWTGKNFILDNKVRGKITIMGPAQVTLQEAYQAFLSALDANGLTTVQSGKYIRIIEAAEARRSPVKTYTGDFAPSNDQYITRILQLKFINADEVQREFRDLVTRQGKLFAYEPTNSIIITDTGSNIQRIKEILDVLDVKGFETTLHVMKIKNSNAKSIADMLGEIYSDDKGRPGQPRSFRKSALERTRGGGVISKIIPDEMTNSLVVLANAAGFIQLRQLVAKLDVRVTDTGRIHVYYCEYAKAEDLANTLASLASGGSKSGTSGSRRTSVSTAPGIPGGAPAASGRSGPVTAELDGGVKITSDSSTNSLVVTANSADYQTLKKVIKKLDIPRLQVFVESAILEVVLDDDTRLSLNAAIGAPDIGFAGGFITDPASLQSALSRGLPGEGVTLPIFAGPSFPAKVLVPGTTSTIDGNVTTFMGLINMLTKTTNSSLLSTPQILALDNEKAEFQVLDETPVIGSTIAATTTAGPTTSVERLKTGIVIKLTPHVNAASKSIRLDIEQKVDSVRSNTQVPKELADKNVATTSRITNTSLVVRDQDYLMMGGLMSDKYDETLAKVPLLGDIPILGWLFKSRKARTLKTNLVILLHPRIINTSLEAADLARKKLDKRRKFIEEYMDDDEQHPEEVEEIDKGIAEQYERAKGQIPYDYRNNDDEPVDDPRDESELSKRRRSQNESAPQLAPVTDPAPNPSTPVTPPPPQPDAPLIPVEGGEGN